jgi:hypothetical protein
MREVESFFNMQIIRTVVKRPDPMATRFKGLVALLIYRAGD